MKDRKDDATKQTSRDSVETINEDANSARQQEASPLTELYVVENTQGNPLLDKVTVDVSASLFV